ncbi:Uncharacterized protein HZ326_8800 [Fusarium oxysporum f. sp. albedinis]|nr:Uncharacterized protein HZ326_8800 [Fusarium oxysporum f. sp. albedinis]
MIRDHETPCDRRKKGTLVMRVRGKSPSRMLSLVCAPSLARRLMLSWRWLFNTHTFILQLPSLSVDRDEQSYDGVLWSHTYSLQFVSPCCLSNSFTQHILGHRVVWMFPSPFSDQSLTLLSQRLLPCLPAPLRAYVVDTQRGLTISVLQLNNQSFDRFKNYSLLSFTAIYQQPYF